MYLGVDNVNIYYCYKVYKYFAKYLFKHDSEIIVLRRNYLRYNRTTYNPLKVTLHIAYTYMSTRDLCIRCMHHKC